MPLISININNKMMVLSILVSLIINCNGFFIYHTTPPRHVTVSVNMIDGVKEGVNEPGTSLKSPLTTSHDMYTEVQTDCIREVLCGTSDGITLIIPSVCVVNRLPPDKAREVFLRYGPDYDQQTIFKNGRSMISERCSDRSAENIYFKEFKNLDKWLTDDLTEFQNEKKTGIEIVRVRIDSKPYAKESDIVKNFQKRAEHVAETKTLIEAAKKIDQENQNALKTAEGVKLVEEKKNMARLERELQNKENDFKKQEIDLKMIKLKAESEANKLKIEGKAKSDIIILEAEANKKLLTPEYLQREQYKSMLGNSKMIIGNHIPKMMFLPGNIGTDAVEGKDYVKV